jgi:hypothetical protein
MAGILILYIIITIINVLLLFSTLFIIIRRKRGMKIWKYSWLGLIFPPLTLTMFLYSIFSTKKKIVLGNNFILYYILIPKIVFSIAIFTLINNCDVEWVGIYPDGDIPMYPHVQIVDVFKLQILFTFLYHIYLIVYENNENRKVSYVLIPIFIIIGYESGIRGALYAGAFYCLFFMFNLIWRFKK